MVIEDSKDLDCKIGMFLCSCGLEGGVVKERIDLEYIKEVFERETDVVHVEVFDNICQLEELDAGKKLLEEKGIDRVVVGGCTPRISEELVRKGLSGPVHPSMIEFVNIREQCAWIHKDREVATKKTEDLMRMGIVKSRYLRPIDPVEVPVTPVALVIGGGVAGMQAALDIANRGYKVHLVEKGPELGGRVYKLSMTFPTLSCGICCIHDCQNCTLTPKPEALYANPNIEVNTLSTVKDIEGHIGSYDVTIERKYETGEEAQYRVTVGTIVVAIGSKIFSPSDIPDYGYEFDDVVTSIDLEEIHRSNKGKDFLVTRPSDGQIPKSVNFIQCVGSRGEKGTNPWCSMICCSFAVGQARAIKEAHPDTEVTIHYLDLRSPYRGFQEYVDEVKKLGVKFVRGHLENVEKKDGGLVVITQDPEAAQLREFSTEMVVLSVGQEPQEGTQELSDALYIPVDLDGFIGQVNLRFLPYMENGVYFAGCAQGPRNIRYAVADGRVAGTSCVNLMAKGGFSLSPNRAYVLDKNCDGCGYCIDPCPYQALTLIEYRKNNDIKKGVELSEAACRGCGICAATCPKHGIFVRGYGQEALRAQVLASSPEVVG